MTTAPDHQELLKYVAPNVLPAVVAEHARLQELSNRKLDAIEAVFPDKNDRNLVGWIWSQSDEWKAMRVFIGSLIGSIPELRLEGIVMDAEQYVRAIPLLGPHTLAPEYRRRKVTGKIVVTAQVTDD